MKRRLRCRHEKTDTALALAPVPNNRRTSAALLRGAALALCAASVSGCSVAIPLSSMKTDDTPTGSIDRTVALLPTSLDREDLRRAKAAMAVTLDPQGNGARAAWKNPQSGAQGSFTAVGVPFAEHDRVCRRFTGVALPAGGVESRLSGSACREGDGTWVVRPAGTDGAQA